MSNHIVVLTVFFSLGLRYLYCHKSPSVYPIMLDNVIYMEA